MHGYPHISYKLGELLPNLGRAGNLRIGLAVLSYSPEPTVKKIAAVVNFTHISLEPAVSEGNRLQAPSSAEPAFCS
jgi:hypothetical protein